jgi:hypothetical protein
LRQAQHAKIQPRWGRNSLDSIPQGSSCLATLGYMMESRWDSVSKNNKVVDKTETEGEGRRCFKPNGHS